VGISLQAMMGRLGLARGRAPGTRAQVPAASGPAGAIQGDGRSSGLSTSRIDRVGVTVLSLVVVVLVVVLVRVGQLQVAPEGKLVPHIQERVSRQRLPAPRGDVVDKRGRTLAATRTGMRAFVDPVEFSPDPATYGQRLQSLADILETDQRALAEKILPRIEANRTLAAGKKPSRYVRVSEVLDDDQVERLREAKLVGVHMERRSVREEPGGEAVASILGKTDVDHHGMFGVEKNFETLMMPRPGRMDYVRDAWGRPMWVEADKYVVPRRGNDARVSIDLAIQEIAMEELQRGVNDADAAGGRCVVLDPATGEVLALVDIVRDVPGAREFSHESLKAAGAAAHSIRWKIIKDDPGRRVHAALGRNRCVEDVYEPGSTFKPFMWSAVTERRLAEPEEVFNTYNGEWTTPYGRRVKDVTPQPELTWSYVLVYSSNIGMVQGTARLSFEQMWEAARRFGFGTRTNIGLPGESAGIVTPLSKFSKYTQTSMASGYEVAVTPLQMVRAFSVFARNGELAGTLPSLRLTAVDPSKTEPEIRTRVLPAWVANLTREVMSKVSEIMLHKTAARNKNEPPFRHTMFGKSGTANVPMPGGGGYLQNQYNSSFLAAAPLKNPRLVCLVVIDDPGPELIRKRMHYGSAVAGPVLARIMRRSLEYYGVPPDIEPPEQVAAKKDDQQDQGG